MKRFSNWPEILFAEIKAARDRPFKYGSHDCLMWPARVIKAYTGTDLARGMRGYKTREGAARVLRERGAGTLTKTLDAIMKKHGCVRVSASMCRRGDLVVAMMETDVGKKERVGGICVGATAAFASDGIIYLSMSDVIRGWKIGV